MKYKFLLLCLLLAGVGITTQAQKTTVAAGGDASGIGGTVAYSIGQVVYTTNVGDTINATQGVQQPYEFFTVTGENNNSIRLELSVYPNPATNYLILKTENFSDLKYELFDVQGKVVESKIVNDNVTNIEMKFLPSTTYFLKISKNNQVVKTFKIIKK